MSRDWATLILRFASRATKPRRMRAIKATRIRGETGMAWTSSAGPQGACVLDGGASSQNVCRTGKAARRTVFGRRARPLALAATAHLCGFAAISPFAADEPIIALPVLIGLVVSYFSLSRLPSLPIAHEAREQCFNEPTARGKDVQSMAIKQRTQVQFHP